MVRIWQCEPLGESPLKERLEALCAKVHFAHAGFKTWGVMDKAMTAAIVGILPRLRYILFTKRLLRELSPQAVEAILAHEMGHNYRRHLLIYPLIFFGMVLIMSFVSTCCLEPLSKMFQGLLFPFVLFAIYALILWLYFRYVYGFFSRQFERQADLHVFALGIAPEAMIEALDGVGVGTGFTHLAPNWHHFSLQERIDFLKAAMRDPQLVERHHAKVKWAIILYLSLLALGGFLLWNL